MIRNMHRAPSLGIATLLLFAVGCSMGGDDYTPARFDIQDTTAIMRGIIDESTPAQVTRLINDHPQVTVIVMQDVEGSVDDEANVRASRMVRAQGYRTHVPSDGLIASGGTDFFVAGTTRTVEPGARVGVHSWADGNGTEGSELPETHPDHALYLNYYAEMGIPAGFYWFTLNAAPASDIYWMTEAELIQYSIVTQ